MRKQTTAKQCNTTAKQCNTTAKQCNTTAKQCNTTAKQCNTMVKQCNTMVKECNTMVKERFIKLAMRKPPVTQLYNEMIKKKVVEIIKAEGHLTHNDFLFRKWLIQQVKVSQQTEKELLNFLKERRVNQFLESHADEIKELFEAIGYKNV